MRRQKEKSKETKISLKNNKPTLARSLNFQEKTENEISQKYQTELRSGREGGACVPEQVPQEETNFRCVSGRCLWCVSRERFNCMLVQEGSKMR